MADPVRVLPTEGNGPYRLLRGVRKTLVEQTLASLANPEGAQRARLAQILAGGAATAFGRAHDLARVRTVEDFRSAVPIRDYAGHAPWLDRVANGERGVLTSERVSMLLETSGTTGRAKHLPVTPSWARTCADAQALWLLSLVRDYEALAFGSVLTIISPAEHARSPGGLPIGANTGRMHLAQPWWLRLRYPVPYRVFGLHPTDLKLYCLLRFALQARITSITTANPSTLLLLCRQLQTWRAPLEADLADGTLKRGPAEALDPATRRALGWSLRRRKPPETWTPVGIWPLVSVQCWRGGPAPYFVDRLPAALGAPLPVREVGITASEGFFAISLGEGDGCVLWTSGHFLEFVGADGVPRGAWELEEGEVLRLVITTEAGLYRYDLDDVVEVVGRMGATPVVRFLGKGRRVLSVTGEKVAEAQAAEALRRACDATGIAPLGFTVGVALAEIPRYRVAVELSPGAPPEATDRLAAAFDTALSALNVEYDTKRESGRLGAPTAVAVAVGTFLRYREARVAAGAPEGQVKDPILSLNDAEWAAVLGEQPRKRTDTERT